MGLDVRPGPQGTEETSRLVQQRRHRRWVIGLGVVVLVFLLAGTTTWIRDALQHPLLRYEDPKAVDVIIVLGSGTTETGDHLPAQAKQRVREGLALLNNGYASRIMFSGGRDSDTRLVEAEEMKKFAVSEGLDPTRGIEEGQSKDTLQNAQFSLTIMGQNAWSSALVVTSPYHIWRACHIFRTQHGQVNCITAPYSLYPANSFSAHLNDTRSVIREYGAIVYNWFKGEL